MKHKKREYQAFQGSLWEYVFHLYEVADIVRQSSDPEFVDILSRVREGKHTSADIEKVEALKDNDSSTRPEKCANFYLASYLAAKENANLIEQLS